jgi:hypothetical protein|tara:strand:+ start:105 stop:392 length:288 start_codon:yes stop_codon:yes gene_type:complete
MFGAAKGYGPGVMQMPNKTPSDGAGRSIPNYMHEIREGGWFPEPVYTEEFQRQMQQKKKQRAIFESMINPDLIRKEYEGMEKALYPLTDETWWST